VIIDADAKNEIYTLLKLTGLSGQIPVYAGSHPLRYRYESTPSEGVDFITTRFKFPRFPDPLNPLYQSPVLYY